MQNVDAIAQKMNVTAADADNVMFTNGFIQAME